MLQKLLLFLHLGNESAVREHCKLGSQEFRAGSMVDLLFLKAILMRTKLVMRGGGGRSGTLTDAPAIERGWGRGAQTKKTKIKHNT